MTGMAVLRPTRRRRRYTAGVALGAGMPWNPRRLQDFQALAAANTTWVRSDLAWIYVEPVQGDWRFDVTFDAVVADAWACNLRYLAILHTVPDWANAGAGDYGPATDPELLENYAYQTAKHYLPLGVTDYEIGNEVNLPHPGLLSPDGAAYVTTTLNPCVTGVRQAATELGIPARIIMGSLAPTDWTGGTDPMDYLTDAYGAGAKPLFDAVAWHPYTGEYTPSTSDHFNADSQALYDIMVANGDGSKRVWATEYGLPTGGANSFTEARQASDIAEAFEVWHRKPFAGPLFVYSGRDLGTSAEEREEHFGVLRNDGSPKPAYAAVTSKMIRAGAPPVGSVARTYTASTANIANPERGLFQYTETHYQADGSGYVALSSATMASARTTLGRALVFRYFVMEKYLSVDTLDAEWLALVATDLTAVRTAGCKAILRFAYSTSGDMSAPYGADPPVARVVSHIEQLADTVNAAADVVDCVQAGFIGMWGEWYYTDNFGDLGVTTTQQMTDRLRVVNALIDNLDARIYVQLRYPGLKERWWG